VAGDAPSDSAQGRLLAAPQTKIVTDLHAHAR
jgi:hypothetical protein